jgi:hypothetical protein
MTPTHIVVRKTVCTPDEESGAADEIELNRGTEVELVADRGAATLVELENGLRCNVPSRDIKLITE